MLRLFKGIFGLQLVVLLGMMHQQAGNQNERSPREQYADIAQEYEALRLNYVKLYQSAKTDEERTQILAKPLDPGPIVKRMLEIAEKYPMSAVALEALVWPFRLWWHGKELDQAVDLIAKNYVTDPRIDKALHPISRYHFDDTGAKLLRGILDINKDKKVQGLACYYLAQNLMRLSSNAARSQNPIKAAEFNTQAENFFDRTFSDYGDIQSDRGHALREAVLDDYAGHEVGSRGEELLRSVIEKKADRNVQGLAYYYLAKNLKNQSELGALNNQPEAADLMKKSEAMFERVFKEYGDIKHQDHTLRDTLLEFYADESGTTGEKLLRTILEKNADRNVQGLACYYLAKNLKNQSELGALNNQPEAADLMKKSEAMFERVFKEYGDIKHQDHTLRDTLLEFYADESGTTGEKLLRTILEKNADRNVQGLACYYLAKNLKNQSELGARKNQPEAAELIKKAEAMFERVAKDYGDVKNQSRILRDIVEPQLFEIRFLSVGKIAPEIDSDDIDGKTFKLSDYRGKVVLLDFWGHW